jgi:hypothetical protein
VAAFTLTLPNETLDELTPSVIADTPSCNAKVFATPPALAVRVTACAELTADTTAVKLPVVDPPATITEAGTMTAELLLARLTAKPPPAAAAFRVTVQLSLPAPVIDPLVQLSPLNTGTPEPLRLIKVELPLDELLVNVSWPVAAPAVAGSNCTVSVAV